jgi:hypothetical protein
VGVKEEKDTGSIEELRMSNLSKMNTVINKLSDEPFEWGKSDCFIFTASLVKAWHGKDYLALHLCNYKDEATAEEYIKTYGGLERLTTGTLGYALKHPEHCIDGDVVTAEVAPGEFALGFVFSGKALLKGKHKVYRMPLKKCSKGWRVK